jgi:3-phenylpropionate/trans-cinnamate dioxygenase ferredoxin reductase component
VNGGQTFVIVGAGLAGAKAAETLRSEGFDGRLVLVGAEAVRPYNRPPLSKAYLRGERERSSIFVHNEGFYHDKGIELLRSTRVTGILPIVAQVETDSGRRLAYDRLLIATGARPRPMNVPGSDLDGIYYLRTIGDSDRLRHELKSAKRLAVIGGGWIGSEVAASARQLGIDVVLIDPRANPLEKVLGPEVGAVFRQLHTDHGVEFRPETRIGSFIGHGTVEGVRTTSGEIIAADHVLVGIGVLPRTELPADAGLEVDDGVVTDHRLRTSAPKIFAAGDVGSAWHPLFNRRLRVEHWANARDQGIVAARNMLGHTDSYDRIPHFLSDQYDLSIEYAGHAAHWDRVVFRGDPASRSFIAFWLAGGRVVAGMNANISGVHDDIEALIRSRREPSDEELIDPDVPLDEIAGGRRYDQAATASR